MDGQVAALASVNTLDEHEESGSAAEMLQTHAAACSDGELEKGCSTAWGGGPDALTMKEACGTSTAADSPPDTSPVVHAHAEIPATGAGEGACEGEHVHADSAACNDHSDGSQQQQTPPPAIATPVSADQEEEVAADAVPAAAATVAADEPDKSEKPIESSANTLLKSSGQAASTAWESARTHAAAAAKATASSVAATDFSAIKEATAKPLLAAASYIGLGSLLSTPAADTRGDERCSEAERGAAASTPESSCEADNCSIKGRGSSMAAGSSTTGNGQGSASSGWALGGLRLPAVTQWLCSANVACSQPLSCTVPVADAETELEGSEAEAAASEHLASVGLSSATATATAAAAAAPAGGAGSDNLQCQDSVECEEPCIADGGTDCAPSTPRATRGARERLLDGRKRVTAAGTVVGDGGDGCRTAVSPEALLGFERELAKLEKTTDAAIACEHSLLPDMGRQGEGVSEEGAKAAAAATTEGMQQDQRQKQKLWKSLQSMLATSSRRSVDVVQQTASTAASAAGAASRALDGLVMPLLGRCMQPTTNARGGSQEAGSEEENGPERAGRKEEGQGDIQGVEGEAGEQSQGDQSTTGSSERRGLLTELQRKQQALAEAVRNRSTNFLQHSVALTSSTSLSEARYHLAEIVDTGGPEVSGVWAGVKVGLGIATLASGHLILGGAMVAVATSSLGSALLWGRHRQEVYEIMRGDYTGDAEASQATSEGSSSAEGNTEEGSGGSGMLSGTAGGGTDSCTETQTPPQSSIAPQPCDAEEKREEKRDETDCNNATIDALTGPGDDSGDAQAST